jgi:hypothetical protein
VVIVEEGAVWRKGGGEENCKQKNGRKKIRKEKRKGWRKKGK